MSKIRKIINKLHRKIFKGDYCNYCGGRLKYDFYDGEFDMNVRKCTKCGTKWC